MNKITVDSAILNIDNSYLDEFESLIQKEKKRKSIINRLIPIAACFIVAVALAIFFKGKLLPDTSSLAADNDKTQPTDSYQIGNQGSVSQNAEATEIIDNSSEITTGLFSQSSANIEYSTNLPEQTTDIDTEQNGGNISSVLQTYAIGSDGCYYKIFNPSTDTFNPVDEMSLENRFCSFNYNGMSFYPAVNGDISADDYENQLISTVKASNYEIRNADAEDNIVGIEYVARIDIYKLKGTDLSEAVACIITFNGETKAYRYNATEITQPSWTP